MYERYFYIHVHVHYSHYYKQKPVYKPYKQNLKAKTKADTDVFNSHKLAKFIALNLESTIFSICIRNLTPFTFNYSEQLICVKYTNAWIVLFLTMLIL